MSPINPASVLNARFKALFNFEAVFPLNASLNIDIPFKFSSVSKLKQLIGSYTPNNDYIYLMSGLTFSETYNFIVVITDGQLNMNHQFQKSSMSMPFLRFGFLQWPLDSSNYSQGCFVDGRINPNPGNLPMTQGQNVNYQIIYGQASIT